MFCALAPGASKATKTDAIVQNALLIVGFSLFELFLARGHHCAPDEGSVTVMLSKLVMLSDAVQSAMRPACANVVSNAVNTQTPSSVTTNSSPPARTASLCHSLVVISASTPTISSETPL